MQNAINWFEIPVADFDRAKKFYSYIFDAEFPVITAGNNGRTMALFPVDFTKATGGAIVSGPGYKPPSPIEGIKIYLHGGEDLNSVLRRVNDAGGAVVVEKTQISMEFGFVGAFIDSEGNWIGLHSPQ